MTEAHAQLLVGIWPFLVPEMILAGVACIVFLGGTVRADRHLWAGVSLLGYVAALVALHLGPATTTPADPALAHAALLPVLFDPLTKLLQALGFLTGILFVLLSWNEVDDRQAADWHACLLILVAGIGLTAAANDLVVLFLALEMVSIPTYVMLYVPRENAAAQEAALKYFLLSVFSSALVVFGFSYLYGIAGQTNLTLILEALNAPETSARDIPLLATVALITIVAGLGFRLKAAPFHFYAPDVFQGGPTVMAALLAWVHKATGFVALLRVLGFVMPPHVQPREFIGVALSEQTPIVFWFLAVITMTWGNALALVQDNLKRLLAYSTVAHAGYMLITLATAPYLRHEAGAVDGVEALLYYLIAYGAMTVGAFAMLAYLSTPERPVDTIDDLAGLSRSHPALALTMAIFLFSLIGVPLTAGFTGKFLIFFGAMSVEADHAYLFWMLAFIGVVNAAIGGWYYLRLIAVMYLRQPLQPLAPRPNLPGLATLIVCVALTLGLGVPPGSTWLLRHVKGAAGAAETARELARR
ncbi:MAG: NADH-quinone oxidoreductase subunit N [Gemmataceae bacterium]|nr:NADH-quinone oxidoreductase subunit N [Gemmataceae bacterium]